MRKNEIFGGREQWVLDKKNSIISEVFNELKPTLDEKLVVDNAVADSLNVINNSLESANDWSYESNNINNGVGASQTKSKVRVLTPNNRAVAIPNNSNNFNNNNSNEFDSFSNGYNNQIFGNYKQSGSVGSLILIFTAILVVMVILVSLLILKYIGI